MANINTNPTWPGWETVRLIGRGSFGAVYEIQRDVFGETEKAALKLITIPQSESDIGEMISDGYDEESITSTFQAHLKSIVAEYSLMRKLNGSANVVNCDDVRYVQHENGFGWDIYIKMELLTPLTSALPAEIPEEQAVKIGKDLARALVQCRQFDIVHRDIKPQNIFVSPLGDYKLGDFGIAKTVERTSGGTKIGTYKYMAPEVYNNQPYGAGADIYSLGLVLYWLLNERRMPFLPLPPAKLGAGMEETARLRRFRGEAIPAPLHGSEELKQIVLKCCAFDPRDRFANADELLQALDILSLTEEYRTVAAGVRASSRSARQIETDQQTAKDTGVFMRTSNSVQKPTPIMDRTETGGLVPETEEDEDATVSAVVPAKAVSADRAEAFSESFRPSEPAAPHIPAVSPDTDDDEEKTVSIFHAKKAIVNTAISEIIPSAPEQDEDATVSAVIPAHHAQTPDHREQRTDSEIQRATVSPAPEKTAPRWGLKQENAASEPKTMKKAPAKPAPQWGLKDDPFAKKKKDAEQNETENREINWDISDDTLTMRVTGKMDNYILQPPWAPHNHHIREIIFKEGITSIGNNAFRNCSVEKCVVIPEGVVAIGKKSFYWCQRLKSIRIPRSMVKIGTEAFFYCGSLTDVYYAGTETEWKAISIGENNQELRRANIHYQA